MYEKLSKIQKLLWKDDDRISQETLFEIQERMAEVLLEVAKKEHKIDDLIKTFPWIYYEEQR